MICVCAGPVSVLAGPDRVSHANMKIPSLAPVTMPVNLTVLSVFFGFLI